MPQAAASNPKMRATGAVLVGLGVLGVIGTATGWGTHGSTGRLIFAIVGVVLILAGIPLLRTRAAALETVAVDAHAITIGLRGHGPTIVPWSDVDQVWLRRLSPVFGGHLLFLQLPGSPVGLPPALRVFVSVDDDGASVVMLGLDGEQADILLAGLPLAGDRYRGVSGRAARRG